MKKIMFNDKYGLTQAVLDGRKTMTRRVVTQNSMTDILCGYSRYQVGEVVAIAQSYRDVYLNSGSIYKIGLLGRTAGWRNKMYVSAGDMPHHIKITNIRVEHLQDISDEDCLREGVYMDYDEHGGLYTTPYYDYPNNKHNGFDSPREAFAALIDKVSGKGIWDSNPMVWVYEFELVD